MATTNKPENEKVEKVELYVEIGYEKDDPNEYVSVNGVNYVLPKGETSMVPPCVKYEYERSRRAKGIQRRNSEAMLKKTNQPIEM